MQTTRNPTTGTLQIPADVSLKALKAIDGEVRRLKRRLYLENAKLRLLKVLFQIKAALAKIVGYLNGCLLKLIA
jgi:hypothetical protein